MLKNKFLTLLLLFYAFNGLAQTTPTPQWRPKFHFTAPTNWLNDPNGLLYLHGEYHLYYQYNPFENFWGHMSWGHATSKDLINWKHHPVAIPEKITKDTTTMIFSGSAVWDKNNVSGFGKKDGAVVAFYTAHLPKQRNESQYIAYSNDKGMTFTSYNKNPAIDINQADFRDPNVFWHQPSKQWVMAVALVKNFSMRFYGSTDLKSWTALSDFGMQGWIKNDWECPFIVPLAVDGNPKNTKWLMMISSGGPRGPLMQYFVGSFDGKTFINDNPKDLVLTVDHGDSFYAAIPWNDAPADKKILLGWLQPGRKETFPWKGQMSIPRDLALKTTSEGIRLIQTPTSVVSNNLQKLSSDKTVIKNVIKINSEEITFNDLNRFKNNAYWIEAEFSLQDAGAAGFKVAQLKNSKNEVIKEIEIGYNLAQKQLYVDCSRSEKDNKEDRNLILTANMAPVNGKVKLQVLVDKSSLEVFGNNGEKVITTMIFPDEHAVGISAFANKGTALVNNLKLWDLSK